MRAKDIDSLPWTLVIDDSVRADRLRRQVDGLRRQLERRIDEVQGLQRHNEALGAALQVWKTQAADANGEAAAARQQYTQLLATRTMRVLRRPRDVYARMRTAGAAWRPPR